LEDETNKLYEDILICICMHVPVCMRICVEPYTR